jgi:hypothetical protein
MALVSLLWSLKELHSATTLPCAVFKHEPDTDNDGTVVESQAGLKRRRGPSRTKELPENINSDHRVNVWTRHNPFAVDFATLFVMINNLNCLLFWTCKYNLGNSLIVCGAHTLCYVCNNSVLLAHVRALYRIVYFCVMPLLLGAIWYFSFAMFCLGEVFLQPLQLQYKQRVVLAIAARILTAFTVNITHEYVFEYLYTLAMGNPSWTWLHNIFSSFRRSREILSTQTKAKQCLHHPLGAYDNQLELQYVVTGNGVIGYFYDFRASSRLRTLRKFIPHRRLGLVYQTSAEANSIEVNVVVPNLKFRDLVSKDVVPRSNVNCLCYTLDEVFLRALYRLIFLLPDEHIRWSTMLSAISSFAHDASSSVSTSQTNRYCSR